MRQADSVTGVVLLAIAAFFIWGATTLPMGRADSIGSGLVPFWEGVFLALVALALIMTSLRQTSGVPVQWPRGESKRMVIHLSLALFVYLALVGYAGYITSTFLFMLAACSAWRRYSWRMVGFVAAGFSLLLFLVFSTLLQTPLPRGPFGLP